MQNVLTTTLGRGRDSIVLAVRRTQETSAHLLGQAARRTSTLRRAVARRRAGLNGKALERLERRALLGVETVLDRIGLGLRAQLRRLAPSTSATPRAGARRRIRVPVEGRSSKRWVGASVEDLAKLPAKSLVDRIPQLGDVEARALLAHEKSTKKRKSVLTALEARLS